MARKYGVTYQLMSLVQAKSTKLRNMEWMWLAAIVAAAVFVYAQTFAFFWQKWMSDAQYFACVSCPIRLRLLYVEKVAGCGETGTQTLRVGHRAHSARAALCT